MIGNCKKRTITWLEQRNIGFEFHLKPVRLRFYDSQSFWDWLMGLAYGLASNWLMDWLLIGLWLADGRLIKFFTSARSPCCHLLSRATPRYRKEHTHLHGQSIQVKHVFGTVAREVRKKRQTQKTARGKHMPGRTGDGNEFASCDLLMARCKDVLDVRMCNVGCSY